MTDTLSTDYDEFVVVSKLRNFYNRAKQEKRRRYDTWRRNHLLLHNKMWSDFRTNWMPQPTDSEILPICSSVVAWMTDQHIEFEAQPAVATNSSTFTQAQALSTDLATVMHSVFETQNWSRNIGLTILDSLIYGAGIFKSVWDQTLDSGMGNADLRRINPWEFYPDPNATDDQDGAYYIEVRRMSIDEIERRFPDSHDKLVDAMLFGGDDGDTDAPPKPTQTRSRPFANPTNLPSPPHTAGNYGLPGQSRLSQRDLERADSLNVYECWFRENKEIDSEEAEELIGNENSPQERIIYDCWRVVVFAAGVILFDEKAEDLYGANTHPYSRYVYEDSGEFWGNALVEHLAPCQIAVNRILASIQQNVELTGNPVFLDVDQSGIARTAMTNRPGQRLTVKGQAANNQSRPGWLTPPTVPPLAFDTIKFWIDRMKNISGLSDISRGTMPNQRAATQTVQQSQEAGFVRIRKGQRNLELSLRRAGQLLATLIVDNYTTPRMVAIVGQTGTQSSLALAARHFYSPVELPDGEDLTPLKYTILVNAGSDNPTSRQSRIAEADTLFAMGAADKQFLWEAHNVKDWQTIQQRMQQEAFQAAALGQTTQPGSRAATRRKT